MDNLIEELVSEHSQLQIFLRGGVKFAIPAEQIAAVADWRRPTALPQAPPAILGVVSIQGRMLTVVDPAVLLDSSGNESDHNGLIVALRGDNQLALLVDEKGEAVTNNIGDDAVGIPVLDVNKLFALSMRGRERRQRRF